MTSQILTIEMFGGLRALHENRVVAEFPPQQAGLVLAYLALTPGRNHIREEIIAAFWPDAEPEEGRQRLRRCLHALRAQLEQPPFAGGDFLSASRTHAQLNAGHIRTDVTAFEDTLRAAAKTPEAAGRIRLLSEAIALYRGDLLPGFYADVFIAERNRLSEVYWSALRSLASAQAQAGDLESAIVVARRLAERDPLREEAHCDLMRLYARAGQPASALRQYQELERILRAELDVAPSETARALAESLRTSGTKPGATASPPSPPLVEPEAAPRATASPPAPLSAAPASSPVKLSRRRLFAAVGGLALGALFFGRRKGDGENSAPPAWNGSRIAFHGGRRIYVIAPDGSQLKYLNPDLNGVWPAWSPDGTKIAFAHEHEGVNAIFVMNADGSHPQPLTNSQERCETPSWSPDGKQIVFSSRREGHQEIYVMNADGTGRKPLTENGAQNMNPTWSPDGTKILFISPFKGHQAVWAMNADGSLPTLLTPTKNCFHARWSPDGKRIVCSSNDSSSGRWAVFVMDADGANMRQLTDGDSNADEPCWSPDGAQVAFRTDSALCIMNADGSGQIRTLNGTGGSGGPSWWSPPESPGSH